MSRNPAEIMVSTGDIKQDYYIIDPVYFHLSNRGVFSSQFSKLKEQYNRAITEWGESGQSTATTSSGLGEVMLALSGEWGASGHSDFDQAFYISVEELKKRASLLDADAIIFMRQDIDLDTTRFQYFYLQIYGTAVSFNPEWLRPEPPTKQEAQAPVYDEDGYDEDDE